MKKMSRIVLAVLAAFGLMGASVSWAGDDEAKAAQAAEAVKADAEKAEEALEKDAKEKVDEVTYKKGEKPPDIYETTANPENPCAAKAANPCGGKK